MVCRAVSYPPGALDAVLDHLQSAHFLLHNLDHVAANVPLPAAIRALIAEDQLRLVIADVQAVQQQTANEAGTTGIEAKGDNT